MLSLSFLTPETLTVCPQKKGEETDLFRLCGLSVTGTALISHLSAQPRDGVAVFLHVKPTCERFAHVKYYVYTLSLLALFLIIYFCFALCVCVCVSVCVVCV